MKGVPSTLAEGRAAGRHRGLPPSSAVAVMVYLALVAALFAAIWHRNAGTFTYTLDDPYIHLALSENLAHGHYGINPGEPSSPSSSILWPFLLIPLAGRAGHVFLPLAWNVLCCGLAAALLGRLADRLPWPASAPGWVRPCAAVLLLLVANLAGLTFVGMEHGLQLLLTVACAVGMLEALSGRQIPRWCLAAAVMGPLVRYENLALVAALAIALWGQRRASAALGMVVCSLTGPALFSVFLRSRGLPAVPSSVLVKSSHYQYSGSALSNVVSTLHKSISSGAHTYTWYPQAALFALLAWLALLACGRTPRFVLSGAAAAAFLQLVVGQFNWFFRYEVYALTFSVLVLGAALLLTPQVPWQAVLAGIAILAGRYTLPIVETPAASSDIYRQQYQMHRFLDGYARESVAVNDLGLVSFDRPKGVYVLDLWGLASPEAGRRFRKDAEWLDGITSARSTHLIIFYPNWYVEGAPDDWTALATMCLPGRPTSVAERCVVFYSTPGGDAAELTRQLAAFARTLPPEVRFVLGKDTFDADNISRIK